MPSLLDNYCKRHAAKSASVFDGLKGLFRPAAGGSKLPGFAQSFARPAQAGAGVAGAGGHAAQLPGMAMGGLMGNFTGDEMGLPGQFTWGGKTDPTTGKNVGGWGINPLGLATGVALGHKGVRNTAAGQTMMRPAMNAMAGSSVGALGDLGASAAGVDTNGRLGQMGAWGGLAVGFGGNRHQNLLRQQALADARGMGRGLDQMTPGFRGGGADAGLHGPLPNAERNMGGLDKAMGTGSRVLDQAWQGGADPFLWAGNKVNHFFTGNKAPALMEGLKPGSPDYFGRRLGQLTVGAPLAAATAGGLYNNMSQGVQNAASQAVANNYDPLREQMTGDMDDYLAQRGFLNQQGRFSPLGGVGHQLQGFAHPLLQMMGMNPQQMSGVEQAAALGGPMMAAGGLMGGNHYLTAAGAGTTAIPHIYRHLQQQQGQVNQPTARNELAVQNNNARSLAQMSGQGYL